MLNLWLGAASGTALLLVLSGGRPRRRVPVAVALALAAGGAVEEVFWRGLVLGRLTTVLGVPAAFVLTTAAFAGAHVPAFGSRGGGVHLLTGSVFGGLCLGTGSLGAAAVSHAAYNGMLAVGRRRAPVASLRGVCKRLGGSEVLRDIGLELHRGEVLALLGANGAGKTTLVSILLGLRRPDSGAVHMDGLAGATPQGMSFPPTVHVGEILDFARAHYDRPLPRRALVADFELTGLEGRQAGGLSGGEQRRLAVALAFAGDPDLVVLDEPTTGLDLESRRAVWNRVRRFAATGGAVLLTTHSLEEARALADRVVVLVRGRVVAEGPPAELTKEARLLELLELDR